MPLRPRLGACVALLLVLAACGEQTESPNPTEASASPSDVAATSESAVPEATPQPPSEFAGAWVDVTAEAIGETGEWTNRGNWLT